MTTEPTDDALTGVESSARVAGVSGDTVQSIASSRHRRRMDWREGGRAVSRWDATVLVAVAAGGGAGVAGALLVGWIQAPWASGVSLATLWLGMLGAVAFAFQRARPAGLLKLRATDFLWGVGLGLTLRVAQGLASQANSSPFPTSGSSMGGLSVSELGNAVAAGLAGPLIEEFFFRAVLLVLIYQAFRRSLGHVAAAVTATLASAGVFVCLHAVFAPLPLADGLQLFLVGVACSALVLLTGRIWGAVFVHVVYNSIFVLLGIFGGIVA